MSLKSHNQKGFTLIEIAVVLVIVGVLVGSFIGSVSSRIETTRRDNTKQQLEEIKEAIIGHAITHGRLPCPTTTAGQGREQPGPGVCTWQHGFVPGVTLGLSGNYNRDDLLTDSWGNPIRYSVSNDNAFTTAPGPGGMADTGMAGLAPDLIVCDGDSTVVDDCAGAPAPAKLTDEAPFILLSLGKDGSDFVTNTAPNSDQGENSGELAVVANAAGENVSYTVGNNDVFVSKSYSDEVSAAGRFDDIVVWESKYVLYSRMMDAGQFP